MVSVARGIRKSTRSKSSTSSAVRKQSQSTGNVEPPSDSPPVAPSRASRASRGSLSLGSDDPTQSPFFMHSADHPGLNIISHRLEETNYGDWSVAMRVSLDAKNKIGFIDGSLPRPLESNSNFRLWSRCNSMVKSWLLNSVCPQIYHSILRIENASDIWRDLHSRFHMTNLPRTYNLTQELQDFRQGSLSLSEYYTRLKTLWDQLDSVEEINDPCTFGKAARLQQKAERAKIVKFLAGLNESYAIIRRQIIAKKVLPSLAEVYNILDQDNSQQGFSNVIAPPAAFQVSESVPTSSVFVSNPADQTICYVQNGPNKGRSICSFCNRVGHIAEICYKKHGFPPGFTLATKKQSTEKNQKSQPLAAQVAMMPTEPDSLESMIGNMNKDQLKQFIAMFSSQLQFQPNNTTPVASTSNSNNTGSYQGNEHWER